MKIHISFQRTYKEHYTPGWLPTYHASIEYQIDLIKNLLRK